MAKVKPITNGGVLTGQYSFSCPGCGNYHVIPTRQLDYKHPIWKFNGNVDSPTFSPSINEKRGKDADPNWQEPEEPGNWSGVCHFVITDGMISFCNDCTHSLAGKTIELPNIE